MSLKDIFEKAAKNPIVIGAGVGLAAAALPVIGIVSGPIIGGAAGFIYMKRKENEKKGPKQ